MPKPSRVVVLSEDQQHHGFVRQYLKRLGLSLNEMRFEELPSGRGSGVQWVLGRYATAVAAFRARSARAQTALVIVLDADAETTERRFAQLSEALAAVGAPARTNVEKIVHLIPRRNIETWILCLSGQVVEEHIDYSGNQNTNKSAKLAALAFFQWSRRNAVTPGHCAPSLKTAIPEARRLE